MLTGPEGQFEGGVFVSGVVKRFGVVVALDGVDLRARPGEVTVLLGPNGAGKSTLMRILATIILPDQGRVWVNGHDSVLHSNHARRSIGLALADERSWYWRLSGRRNLEFFGALYGFDRRGAAKRVDQLLGDVGLTEAGDRRFDSYSSGMKARLSLARALLPDPAVLLLDEPTRSLDPVSSVAFRNRIANLTRESGIAVIYATHDLHEASSIADQVIVLAAGRVAFTSTTRISPEELESVLLDVDRK